MRTRKQKDFKPKKERMRKKNKKLCVRKKKKIRNEKTIEKKKKREIHAAMNNTRSGVSDRLAERVSVGAYMHIILSYMSIYKIPNRQVGVIPMI